jgi:diguanylate cyclase (GGDEF)-like protein/PAS domain S-box-containing protein
MFGYESEEITGRSLGLLMPERYRDAHHTGLSRVAAGGARHLDGQVVEVEGLRKDGSEFPLELTVTTWDKGGQVFFGGILRDISERKHAQERIAHLAHHDGLTGLPNRVLFRDRLDQALARARRESDHVAVLCLDLDRFKEVNDVFGHPAGDALLKQIANLLAACVRETDTVARLGGDEFAIVQVGLSQPSGVSVLVERIFEELAGPLRVQDHDVLTGTSIGIAIAPVDGNEPDSLLKNADIALYRAKAEGRGTFRFFEPGMDARLQARRLLEHQLRLAFAQEHLEIHYQPQVDLVRNQIVGFEALVRWPHPDWGHVPPAEFIPIAEETGLILQLGEWVLRRACQDAAAWPPAFKVAVNLSPVQFQRGDLAEVVASALETAGLEPSRLELEITEGTLVRDAEGALAVLRRLKDFGVRIAMDDFGTGYSSLSYLRRFPFDKIKIDQSFIRGLEQNPDDAAIVRATLGLGHSLGLATTAEGVETHGQASYLRAQGCQEVQGFLYGRPTPVAELRELIEGGLSGDHRHGEAAQWLKGFKGMRALLSGRAVPAADLKVVLEQVEGPLELEHRTQQDLVAAEPEAGHQQHGGGAGGPA